MGSIVLVTGVSRYLGSQLARNLIRDPAIERVIGVDIVPPTTSLEGIEFIRADIGSAVIAKVLGEASVDTVVHMGVIATPRQAGGRAIMKEINVIGSMQLLAACQRAPSVKALVVKSTACVYGTGPRAPAMITEEMEARHAPASGWAKDSVEVEAYLRAFGRRRPDVCISSFRFANFIGPAIDTAMTSYFSLPVIPTVLGYDPRLQFIHEDDGLEYLRLATTARQPGTFNVAGHGVLTLSQAIRRTGHRRVALPEFMFIPFGRSVARAGLMDFTTEQVRFLSYGRVLDTSLAERTFRYVPAYSSSQAFASFLARHGDSDV